MEIKKHFKMYKSGKQWCVAALATFARSSPKCWCKLNSANLSFHKLKHTGFF